jgi:hypothetical protein
MSAALHSIVQLMAFNSKVEQTEVELPLGTDCVRLSRVYCIYILMARAPKRFLPCSEVDRDYVFPDPYHVYQLQRDTSNS